MTAKIVNKNGRDLAKDVLAQLRYQKIRAGSYFLPTPEINDLIYVNCDTQAQKYMGKLRKCSVCAKGALVLAYIKKYNNLKLSDIEDTAGDEDTLANLLEGFFSLEQLNLIEHVFECRDDSFYIQDYKCIILRKKVPNDKTRLRLIMQNIVKNGGVFVIEKFMKDLKIPKEEYDMTAKYSL